MKRTKPKLVPLANDVVRPSPFKIVSRSSEIDYGRKVYQYGNTRVIVYGHLTEYDRGTFLCILEMSEQHKHQRFEYTLVDLAKARGYANPYDFDTLDALGNSIDRLLDARIRIRPADGKKGISAAFNFIEGWLDSDYVGGDLHVTPYLDVVRDLSLGSTNVNINVYLKLRSAIARSLYAYLESQKGFYEDHVYEIRLKPLLQYINYDTGGRSWWRIHQTFKKACDQLVRAGKLESYHCDGSKYRNEGGFWTFTRKRKAFEDTKKPKRKKPEGKNREPETDKDFELFWEAYPKKQNKQQAFREWKRAKDLPDIDNLLGAIHDHGTTSLWNEDGGRFIPLPQNYLRNKKWNEHPGDMVYNDYSRKRKPRHGAQSDEADYKIDPPDILVLGDGDPYIERPDGSKKHVKDGEY